MLKLKATILRTTLTITPKLWSNSDKKFINQVMQYDTGAFMTVLDYSIVEQNGYKIIPVASIYDPAAVKGIGGSRKTEYTVIPNVQINGVDLGSVYACVIDFDGDREVRRQIIETLRREGKEPVISQNDTDIKAILGLNFIRGFYASTEFMTPMQAVITLQPKFDLDAIDKGEEFNPNSSIFGSFYSEFTLRRTLFPTDKTGIYSGLSSDAHKLMLIIRETGFAEKIVKDTGVTFRVGITDIDAAFEELIQKQLIEKDESGDVYRVKG